MIGRTGPTAPKREQHKPWCVRPNHTGACSEKRGHWDRSTNTWDSELTDKDRKVIAEAFVRWKEQKQSVPEVMAWVREQGDTLSKCDDHALLTWWMTHHRLAGMGRSWPI